MPTMEEVAGEVRKEIDRIGQDTKKLTESMQRDLAALRSVADTATAKAEANHGEVEALKTSVLERSTALEKSTKTLEATVGDLQEQVDNAMAALKRPATGGADASERVKQAIYWKTSSLAMRGKLEIGADVESLVDLKELEAYEKSFRVALSRDKQELDADQLKALSSSVDPRGGYLITPAMSQRVIGVIRETSPLRQLATVETIGTDKLEMPRDMNRVTSGWVGEEEARAETTTPEVGHISIAVNEMYAKPRAPQTYLEDASINAEAWLAGKIGEAFALDEASAFISGNGVNKPRGLLSYATATTDDASRSWGTFQHVLSGAAAGVTADVLKAFPYRFKEGYTANANWMMNRLCVLEIMLLKDGEGRYLWQPSMTDGQPSSLLGYPLRMATDMPTFSTNSLSIAFGDFARAYTIVDRLGITTLRDPYSAKPLVEFYSRRRVGGAAVHFESVKFIKTGT